jgi:hypothetical protein
MLKARVHLPGYMYDTVGFFIARWATYITVYGFCVTEAYKTYHRYHLLNAKPNNSIAEAYNAKHPSHEFLLNKIRKNYNLGYNYLAPATFATFLIFHALRLHRSRFNTGHGPILRTIKTLSYAIGNASIITLLPFMHTYTFYASSNTCKTTAFNYYKDIMDHTDPNWRNYFMLTDAGRFVTRTQF